MDEEIVVIGKNYSTSLGIIKAVGEAGNKVIAIRPYEKKKPSLAPEASSRYVEKVEYVQCEDEKKIIDLLIHKVAADRKKRLVIPTDDASASLLDKHADVLKDYFFVPQCNDRPGDLTFYMDKGVQKEYAKKCDIDVAEGWTIDVKNGKYNLPSNIIFPCYMKPQVSIGAPKSYIRKCDDIQELICYLEEIAQKGDCCILVEQYIAIEKEYVVPGISCGQMVVIPAFIEKIKIGSGAHKGVTMKGRVVSPSTSDDLRDKLVAFVKCFHFKGIFDIEILESGGRFFFNELNLRNGAATYGITASDVNLPDIFCKYMLEGIEPTQDQACTFGKVFVSEKVELEAFRDGYLSWKEYRNDVKESDIRFIKDCKDIKPYLQFRILEGKAIMKRIATRK